MRSAYTTMEAQLRADIIMLFEVYGAHVGYRPSTVGGIVCGDPQIYGRIAKAEIGFRVRSYDQIVARFRTVWPPALGWPPGIPEIDEANVPQRFPPPQPFDMSTDVLKQRAAAVKHMMDVSPPGGTDSAEPTNEDETE